MIKNKNRLWVFFWVFFFFGFCPKSGAENKNNLDFLIEPHQTPIQFHPENPLLLLFIDQPHQVPLHQKGQWAFSWEHRYSNIFDYNPNPLGVGVLVDAELSHHKFVFGYGLSKVAGVQLKLSTYSFYGGFLDGLISGYHKTFGFPNGDRDLVPNNQTHYHFWNRGQDLFAPQPKGLALGDVQLSLPLLLSNQQGFSFYFIPSIKIPLGQKSAGVSSAKFDLAWTFGFYKKNKKLSYSFQTGLSYLGTMKEIAAYQKRMISHFAFGLHYHLSPRVNLNAQLYFKQSPFKNTGIPQLDRHFGDITFGAGFRLNRKTNKPIILKVGLSEDLLADGPSIDFTLFSELGFYL